ncbi:anti-anti-sigma factor [Rhodobacteraceae bacterium (ex Bugula neritina AB1)]|nr:anti-anti-sigma factor [Rhodobacteraceae bacterium (ex Bugula neritina AB1)]
MAVRVPILRQGSHLIASIQEELTDSDILNLQTRILDEVVKRQADGVIIDVGALDVIDSFGTRTLAEIAAAVQLRGAKMVIVGIQPEVALSMVLLGLTLDSVPTMLDLDAGIAELKGSAQ